MGTEYVAALQLPTPHGHFPLFSRVEWAVCHLAVREVRRHIIFPHNSWFKRLRRICIPMHVFFDRCSHQASF